MFTTKYGNVDTAQVARDAAHRAAELIQADGRFRSAYEVDTDVTLSGYDEVRHCGTCWAIADVANSLDEMDAELEAAGRAMTWIVDEKTVQMGEAQCVVSGDSMLLGGSALAILALLELAKHGDQDARMTAAKKYGDFIVACRRDDGDFHHRIDLVNGKFDTWRSDFYTGEALFALSRLSWDLGEDRYRNVVAEMTAMLARKGYGIAKHSHWMAYALSALHELTGEEALIVYAGQIVRAITDQEAYRQAGSAAAIACRTEALAGYGDMLVRAGGTSSGPVGTEVMATMRENLELLMDFRLDDGGFINGPAERRVQIDTIQHAASAFLGYDRLSRMGLG